MEDPFFKFLSTLSDKIKVEKEHKDLMKNLEEPSKKEASLEDAINILREKIIEQKKIVIPKEPKQELIHEQAPEDKKEEKEKIEVKPSLEVQTDVNSEDLFGDFVGKLKDLLSKPAEIKPEVKPEPVVEVKPEEPKKEIEVKSEPKLDKIVKQDKKQKKKEIKKDEVKDIEPVDYVNLMDQLSNNITKEEEKGNVSDVKKLLEEYTEKYLKKMMVMQEYAGGGGSVAKQYAHGGTMDGDLNVTGQYLSAGVNLSNLLSGGGGGDPNVNTVVYSNSANWNSSYTTTKNNSAFWADTRNNVVFGQDVTIQGNLTALGSSTFKNTIFTTTSALSVVNTGPGPALYVFQAAGPYDVASFYDGDGVEVLHVGNANVGQTGKVGINESFPSVELTVNGQISSNSIITDRAGNSDQWNTAYSNLVSNSGIWDSTYSTVQSYSGTWNTGLQDLFFDNNTALLSITNGNTVSLSALSGGGGGDINVNTVVYAGSAKWNSNFTTTNYFSAFWNAAVDELFNFYVTQTDPGSAFIAEDGNYYLIANSKLYNNPLWDSAYTQVFLLSSRWSSVYVTVLGVSARWDFAYTFINQNSAKYDSVYSTTNTNSGSWSSVYQTYRSLSASYAAETLAIAYAVAL